MHLLDNYNNLLGDDLRKTLHKNCKLRIAAACFSIYAFEALQEELEKVDSLEFIFTAKTFVPNEASDKFKKERREFLISKLNREKSIYGTEFEIHLKNKLTQRAIAKECADWIRRKAKFRSNKTNAPMQQFACLENDQEKIVYAPLNGFTAVDLGYQQSNAVSNIVHKIDEAPLTHTYFQLFNQIWHDKEKLKDVTDVLCTHIESVYQENSPEKIYFHMLYNIFNEFLDDINEDVLPNDLTGYKNTAIWQKLYNFQRDAATGIINKLESYNGCILADSVGLGKTFTALAVIKYYELRNKSVLVLCPKKIADNWLNYNRNLKTNIFSKDRFNYDVLCHTDLQRATGESFGTPLSKVNWGNYDLVVIDESHNFRNNDIYKDRETRYQKLMNSVIREGVKTKVLMLSATPVNNRFNDLRNQLALAYEGDSEHLRNKLKVGHSIEEIFRQAQMVFNEWSKLPAPLRTASAILEKLHFDFFELLDSVTIARSRKHIQKFYDAREFGTFPTRLKPLSYRCPITMREDVIGFNEIYLQLSKLKLSIYAPIAYILPSRIKKYEDLYDTDIERGAGKLRQIDRERSLQNLMTVNLLKRLESSVEAFRQTLLRLHRFNADMLEKIQRFRDSGAFDAIDDLTDFLQDVEAEEDDLSDFESNITGGKVKVRFEDMDLDSWEYDLSNDLAIINFLLEEMVKVTPKDDAKLTHIREQIENKILSPINNDNKKVLIFSAFIDTTDYLYDNLADYFKKKYNLHTAEVTGQDRPTTTLGKGYDFQTVLTLFSPKSKEKNSIFPDEPGEIDILIGTDCISEGQNLQDCDYVINYDIHWNPVRIIQRFGRIDRIGSTNQIIQLVNYWPDISLDEYINLKERVENRMVIADVTATGDDNVLLNQSQDISFRKEQLRRLQEEVIDLEDIKTGVNITDLGLNDFRMDLVNYVKTNDDLLRMPNGLHALVPANRDLGLLPGVIFALRNINSQVNVNQSNRLHPYYLVYVSDTGETIIDHTQIKKLLDLVRSSCNGISEPIYKLCRQFNRETRDGREMARYSELLSTAIQSIIQIKEEKDLDSLFTSGKTTALVDTIAGLDDFELIDFLIIQEPKI
jgi:hypothetical protein